MVNPIAYEHDLLRVDCQGPRPWVRLSQRRNGWRHALASHYNDGVIRAMARPIFRGSKVQIREGHEAGKRIRPNQAVDRYFIRIALDINDLRIGRPVFELTVHMKGYHWIARQSTRRV